VGASKTTIVHAVKVLSASGSGATSGIVAGCNWVQSVVAANPALRPAVVSMSLGGGASAAMDDAVRSLVAAGITTVVAAGNANADACLYSPAREPSAITVAASTVANAKASFSNFGRCVDLFAPGENILSSVNAVDAYAAWSGTSMATPHVTGVVALMLSAKPCLTPATVASILLSTANSNVLSGITGSSGTPNKMVNARAAVAAAEASTTC
jgi:subtilisin family serine protease